MRGRSSGVLAVLLASACARGMLDGDNGDGAADASPATVDGPSGQPPADAGPSSADAGSPDTAPAPIDAPPASLGLGDPCTADAQCATTSCRLVHADAGSTSLCTQTCGLFNPCPAGASCYGDGTSQTCVRACPDASPCPSGLTCRGTYPPEMGCLPGP